MQVEKSTAFETYCFEEYPQKNKGKGKKVMRLNGKRVMGIMRSKSLTADMICTKTGLCEKSLCRILDNGFVSVDAMERIAGAIGVEIREILLPDISSNVENGIEFIKDSDRATVSFS